MARSGPTYLSTALTEREFDRLVHVGVISSWRRTHTDRGRAWVVTLASGTRRRLEPKTAEAFLLGLGPVQQTP